MPHPDIYRLSLDFNEVAYAEFVLLKRDCGAASRADTVRFAMKALRWVIDKKKEGDDIMVARKGETCKVEFPFLDPKHRLQSSPKSQDPVTTRLVFDYTPEAFNELTRLKEDLGAEKNADVIRCGMRTLQWILQQHNAGADIMIGKDGIAKATVTFPFLPEPRAKTGAPPQPRP